MSESKPSGPQAKKDQQEKEIVPVARGERDDDVSEGPVELDAVSEHRLVGPAASPEHRPQIDVYEDDLAAEWEPVYVEDDRWEPEYNEDDELDPDYEEEAPGRGPRLKVAPGPKHHPGPPHEHGPEPKKGPSKKAPGKKAPGKKVPGKKAHGPKKHPGPPPPHEHGPHHRPHHPDHRPPRPPHEHRRHDAPREPGTEQDTGGPGPGPDFGGGSDTGFGGGPGPDFGFDFDPRTRGRRRGSSRGRRGRPGDVRAAILKLLTEGPLHGYEMIQRIAERSQDAWRLSPGSVYPTLQLLDDEGLIAAAENGGSKKLFELTDDGRTAAGRITTAPWEQFASGVDSGQANVRETVNKLFGAVTQALYVTTVEQQQRVVTILQNARRQVYALLAESE